MTDQSNTPTLTKRDRRKRKRTARLDQSAAAAAENWTDRPDTGKARPTPQRKAKGTFVLRDGEDAGVTVAVDLEVTMLDRLCTRGVITGDQRDGGHDFAALMDRTRLVSRGRSCLDFSPVGHDGDLEPTHAELRDSRERAAIYAAMGMLTFAEMRRVCCEGFAVTDRIRLKAGLDICVAFWKTGA